MVSLLLFEMREAELVLWSSSTLAKPVSRQSLGTSSSGLVGCLSYSY